MSEPFDTSRREFLRGRKADQKNVPDCPGTPSLSKIAPPSSSKYLEQYTKTAMACQFEMLLNLHQYAAAGQAVMDSFELIDRLEDQLTVYRDHSEVSQLNRNAADNPVQSETELFKLLQLARRLHAETQGAFDITSSALTRLWGFDQRSGQVPTTESIENTLRHTGSEGLILDSNHQTVRFKRDGLSINLGGIGKGHALDRVAGLMEDHGVLDFVIHGGQSSVLARGENSAGQVKGSRNDEPGSHAEASPAATIDRLPQSENGWVVGLSHPTIPGLRLAQFNLRNQALGTSGTGRQGFFHEGKRYGHIIDPRTGWPTEHVLSATVISPSAAVSDALATAFFVMSLDEVADYCQTHPDVAALLVLPGSKTQGQIAMEWFNLNEDQWTKLI